MKKIYLAIALVMIVVLGVLTVSLFHQKSYQADKSSDMNSVLLDVRTPSEYSLSHIDGAINYDLARLQSGEMPKISKSTYIKLYCRSGARAGEAKSILEAEGFKNVLNLGGINSLQNQGYKLVGNS